MSRPAIYWWLPVRLLMKDTFDSEAFIAAVKVPLLIQHGDADAIIPGRSMAAAFSPWPMNRRNW